MSTHTIREKKGQSILKSLSNYVVIDLETTGLDPKYDSIIEFGAIRYRNSSPSDTFSTLVNPGFEIDSFIEELTGITNAELAQAPALSTVLPSFLEFVGNDIVIGHNVNFDVNFIYDATETFGLSPFSNNFVDTMRISRRLFKEYSHHRLSDLIDRFGIEANGLHRALADCHATAECYAYMMQYASENHIDISAPPEWRSFKASSLTATTESFDENHPLFGRSCVFTGVLQQMARRDAMQAVVNLGGLVEDRITKNTNYLILGNNDYCSSIKDGKSNKQKKAEQYKLDGQDIEIISENTFYDLVGVLSAPNLTSDDPSSLLSSFEYDVLQNIISVLQSNGITSPMIRWAKTKTLDICSYYATIRIGKVRNRFFIAVPEKYLNRVSLEYEHDSTKQTTRFFLDDPSDVLKFSDYIITTITVSIEAWNSYLTIVAPSTSRKHMKDYFSTTNEIIPIGG